MRFTAVKYTIREYLNEKGVNLYRTWLRSLDLKFQARIQARISRMEDGNLGDIKPVGCGVWEGKLDFGPGYRVYFGFEKKEMILLLIGGDKGSQKKDIKKAQEIWVQGDDND